MMQTTKASTDDVDTYTSIWPAPVRTKALELFAELERYRAATAHAREVRSCRIEDAIIQCYRDHQRLLESLPLRSRTARLCEKLANALKLRPCLYALTAMPRRSRVKEIVYRLSLEIK
ncbi:MAG: hypothetical protein HYZ18_15145 [Pseudogulbenkiania sp.]|nr:hypothetical protein [Pseudogulbenkiania sp.]